MNKINPLMFVIMYGGTTTKIAIYEGNDYLYKETLYHTLKEMKSFKNSLGPV